MRKAPRESLRDRLRVRGVLAVLLAMTLGCAPTGRLRGGDTPVEGGDLELLGDFPLEVPEPSGIVWRPDRRTLWVVSDRAPVLYELSERGKVLGRRRIPAASLEGITWDPARGLFWVVQESPRRALRVTPEGRVNREFGVRIPRSIPEKGLEGVAYVASQDTLYMVNERVPCMLVRVDPAGAVQRYRKISFALDLSGLSAAPGDDGLLLLSDMDARLYWIGFDGTLRRSWDLPCTKAEGVTADDRGRIYVVSDAERRLLVFRADAFPATAPSPGA